jgi:FtsZ-interacting cell division protein ZipA
MSTIAIIAIVIGALIILALLVSLARRGSERKQLAQAQSAAQRDDAQHHRERAEEQRTEAAVAEERAERAKVEAELNEERAAQRDRELDKS